MSSKKVCTKVSIHRSNFSFAGRGQLEKLKYKTTVWRPARLRPVPAGKQRALP